MATPFSNSADQIIEEWLEFVWWERSAGLEGHHRSQNPAKPRDVCTTSIRLDLLFVCKLYTLLAKWVRIL